MLKLNIPPYSIKVLDDFKLKKSIEAPFIKEELDAQVLFGKTEFTDLLNKFYSGSYKETGVIQKQCGSTTFTKDCSIKHSNGDIDLTQCEFEKKVSLDNPLDCVVLKDVNIFDYTPDTVGTIRGTIETDYYKKVVGALLRLNENGTIDFSLDYLLEFLGGIPDRTFDGWYIQGMGLIVSEGFQLDVFELHLVIKYIRNTDSIKHSSRWLPLPNSSLFYYQFDIVTFGVPSYNTSEVVRVIYQAGHGYDLASVNISNTYSVNEILLDIFLCSGYTLRSNFFGINPDNTHPNNSVYSYALEYCQNIRMCQSYDIIKEAAQQDSFGISGKIPQKEFLSDLAKLFGLFIVPDETTSSIRIEHNSYFSRSSFDARNRQYKLSKLKINEREIDKEIFSFAAETPTPGFYKIEVKYENADLYRQENSNSPVDIKLFITDIAATLNNKEFEKDEFKKLFYLLCCDSNKKIIEFNYPFSMKSLFNTFHQFQRPFRYGKVSGSVVNFSNFSQGLSGTVTLESSILGWNTLQPMYSITLKEGTFQIVEIEIDKNNQLEIKIRK